MKNALYAILFISLFSLAGSAAAHAAANSSYCPGKTIDPFSFLCSGSSTYQKGQPITFTIYQSKIPLSIGPLEHPWHVVNSKGNVIYTPSSTPPTTPPDNTTEWSDTWNQINNAGKQVKKGTYLIEFENVPYNVAPLLITITKKAKEPKGKDK